MGRERNPGPKERKCRCATSSLKESKRQMTRRTRGERERKIRLKGIGSKLTTCRYVLNRDVSISTYNGVRMLALIQAGC